MHQRNNLFKHSILILTLTFTLLASGCAQIVGIGREEPIKENLSKRTFGTYLDDEVIETKALVNMRKSHPDLQNSHLVAVSYHGVVLLAGQVPSQKIRKLATETVSDIKKVRKVYNEMEVRGKTGMLIRSNDAWITSKVKGKLSLADDVNSGYIKVVTENSVVYMMGKISKSEADLAASIASKVNGVQRVVRLFEQL
jgi:osmotically-inducible protein OsmY